MLQSPSQVPHVTLRDVIDDGVLEKCGFQVVGYERGFSNACRQEIDEAILMRE